MSLTMRKMLHNFGALAELGTEISSTHDFDEVVRASLHMLLGTLAIPRGAIARYSHEPHQLKVVAAKGLQKAVGQKITLDHEEVAQLTGHSVPVNLEAEQNGLSAFVHRNSDVFKRLRAHTTVPMVARGELMGMIFLSEKFTREDYDAEDVEIINTITRHIAIAFYNHRLMVSLRRKAEENQRLYREMHEIYRDTVKAFGAAIDLKDAYTSGHSERVGRYCEAIARELGMAGRQLDYITVAGYLHDIGKITVDRSIINNPRPLTEREFKELNKHAATGFEILSHIRHPWDEIAQMAGSHHEKVDGTGYPRGLSGEQIPLGARIVTLADSFDAMMTDRPYRARLPLDRALADLSRNTGTQFCATVAAAFCRLLLKEITGATRERVFLPVIGIKFDRPAIIATLSEMILEFEAQPLAS
ncbi:MAG TPA: HD domain-containing phosphohydrolase [Blastocatellia bacterium]|nr:HD domain-containing phosphohydrolase [Blastocatellia bacterium]